MVPRSQKVEECPLLSSTSGFIYARRWHWMVAFFSIEALTFAHMGRAKSGLRITSADFPELEVSRMVYVKESLKPA